MFCFPSVAGADIIDAEIFNNHIEQLQQMNDQQQFRRTMNRIFDARSALGGASGQSSEDVGIRVAMQRAAWRAALVVPVSSPQREFHLFLEQTRALPHERQALRTYLLARFAAYPSESRQASFDPRNVADARLFALQTAYRAVRPEPIGMPATLMLSVALSRQMTESFTVHRYTTQQRQAARDYYIIARALILPAVQNVSGAGPIDAKTRELSKALARSLVMKDTGVDPARVSWDQLPCVGVSEIVCRAQTEAARDALGR